MSTKMREFCVVNMMRVAVEESGVRVCVCVCVCVYVCVHLCAYSCARLCVCVCGHF